MNIKSFKKILAIPNEKKKNIACVSQDKGIFTKE